MTQSVSKYPHLEAGTYNGYWGGHNVVIVYPNGTQSKAMEVQLGIKCIKCKCRITIDLEGTLSVVTGDWVEEELYYIQNGYVGNAIMWWRHDSKGYTTDFDQAGKYTKEQALGIIKRPEDRAWPCSYVDGQKDAHRHIVDGQYLSNSMQLESTDLPF